MAEDAFIEEDLPIEEGRGTSQRPRVYGGYLNRQCNARLEELAKPKKWLMLATWREHRYIFDPDRMQMLKEKIQEEFSMTPEETEVYFNQLRNRARRIFNRKALARQIRREKALAKGEAYRLFRKLLRNAMKYAFIHPPPPIVSPVMRETSNKVLQLLCSLHNVCVPKRDNTDKKSLFLLYLSDWAAILISNIYYEVNVKEKLEAERFKQYSKASIQSSEKEGGEEGDEDEKEEEEISATTEGETTDHTSTLGETEDETESPLGTESEINKPSKLTVDETDEEENFYPPE